MGRAEYVVNDWGQLINFEAARNLMDDFIVEDILIKNPFYISNQTLFDWYCQQHLEQYGEEFEPNKRNGQW